MRVATVAVAFALFGCQQVAETGPLQQQSQTPIRDAGFISSVRDGGTRIRDAGIVRPPPRDGGVRDGGVVTANRRLVEHRLFGTMPLDNLVLNPQFDQHSTLSFVFGGGPTRRYHWSSSPMGLPVAALDPFAETAVPVQSRDVDLDVSVWIGTEQGVPVREARAVLFGLDTNGRTQVLPLALDNTPEQTHEGVTFGRFSARIQTRFLGLTALSFRNEGGRAMYVNGPVAVPANSRLTGVTPATVRPVALDEVNAEQLRGIRERLLEAMRRGI